MNSKQHLIIHIHYEYPPIPDRRWDWVAYFDGEEECGLRGWGKTKEEAVLNLLAQFNFE